MKELGCTKSHCVLYRSDNKTIVVTGNILYVQSELESVAIANALQLEGYPKLRQSLSALITTPMPSLKLLSLSVAIL